jgi:uncharacterized membrane protein YcgQ (UPF0703/DUF1980 family)
MNILLINANFINISYFSIISNFISFLINIYLFLLYYLLLMLGVNMIKAQLPVVIHGKSLFSGPTHSYYREKGGEAGGIAP